MRTLHFSLCTTGPPDSPPMNITASNITYTSFVVQWDEVDDALSYAVYVSNSSINNRRDINRIRTRQTSLTYEQLTPNTSYYVSVANFNGCGDGAFSGLITVFTNATLSSISMPPPTGNNYSILALLSVNVIVVPQHKYDIVVITRVRGKPEYECYDIIQVNVV